MMIEKANSGLHNYIFNNIIGSNKPGSVLDIGCGTGAWLNRFKQKSVPALFGIDLDVDQFEAEGITAKAVNLDNYSGEVFGKFELITAIELIEHLESPGNLIRLLKNNLATDGMIIISTPNIHSVPARLRFLLKGRLGYFDDQSDPTHIYPVYTENLERILKRHGLCIHEIYSFPENKETNYSGMVKLLSGLISPFVKKGRGGDNIIYKIRFAS